MKNIAFVLTQSLDSPSGLGRYGPLARELAKLGYDVEIIALHHDWENLEPREFIESNVKVKYVAQMHVLKRGSRKTYFRPNQLLKLSLIATYRLAHALRNSEAEVIQLCKPQPFNTLATRLSHQRRPIYCDCDDYEAETNLFSNTYQKQIVRYFEDGIVNIISGLSTNTLFTQNRYIKLGVPREKIVYVPNGIERNRFIISDQTDKLRGKWCIPIKTPVILYVGTLGILSHPINLLLEAFHYVLQQMPETRLILVGGGEDYDFLQQKASQLGISKNTIFTGRVHPNEVPSYYKMATVTVDPINDDLIAQARSPLKIIESIAMGVPVVTSNVGDRYFLLAKGRAGILVPPGDPVALSEGLLSAVQQKKARNFMSEVALAHSERFYWDVLVKDFLKQYE
jgi:glycosyltransferase involved in cell wall biosynthesis